METWVETVDQAVDYLKELRVFPPSPKLTTRVRRAILEMRAMFRCGFWHGLPGGATKQYRFIIMFSPTGGESRFLCRFLTIDERRKWAIQSNVVT